MSYKTTDGLMRHLRDTGIDISGSTQKRQLINTGYYHGYKGYRFFKTANNTIPFSKYSDIYNTIMYDSRLKSLFYGKIMFIETAVKNIALERILKDSNSESIQDMYRNVVSSYNNIHVKATEEERQIAQTHKLQLQNSLQSIILKAYSSKNPIVTHFYNNMNYGEIPLWALFEILSMGDFAHLLSCLTYDTRDHITKDLGMQVTNIDSNKELIYKYLYTLKDLRNAIAHNLVVFDTRFNQNAPSKAMKLCLENRYNLPYVNFKSIGDYLILICYYLQLLHCGKKEIVSFINDFRKITDKFNSEVSPDVSNKVIHSDLYKKLLQLESQL